MRKRPVWKATWASLKDGSQGWCVTKIPGGSTYWCVPMHTRGETFYTVLTGARQAPAAGSVIDKMNEIWCEAIRIALTKSQTEG